MCRTYRYILVSALLALLFCLPAAAVCRRGDLDGDGRISVTDAFLTLKSALRAPMTSSAT